jgi:lipopolysaccharide export system permease protein
MNDYFLPIGTLNFGRLYRKLLYSHPELEIEGYSVKNFQDSIITTGKVGQEGIQGLLIIDKEPEGNKRIITAGNARVDKDREGVIGLVLEDVVIHSLHKKEKDRYSYTFAEGMVYSILIKNISMAFRSPGPREMSSIDVFKEIQKKRAVLSARRADTVNKIFSLEHEYIQNYRLLVERLFSGEITLENAKENLTRLAAQMKTEGERKIQDRSLQIHLIEFYKKFSIPFSCIPFVILAFPIGLFTRRSGRSVGFGVGLFVSIFYWGMLVAGQTLGIRADFSPLFSMWVPNFVILILGISAFIMRFRG